MKDIDDVISVFERVSNNHNGNVIWRTDQIVRVLEKYRDYLREYMDKDIDIYWHRSDPNEDCEYLVKFADDTYAVIKWSANKWQSDKDVIKWKRIID